MRVNGASPIVKAVLAVACLGTFIVAWPIAFNVQYAALPGVKPTDDDTAGYGTTFAIIFVGIFMGIHASLMIAEQSVWLRGKWKRTTFLIISGMFAACVTYANSIGGNPDQKGPVPWALLYFLAVQFPPLLWFLFNLHGKTWLDTLARWRRRRQNR